MIRQQHYGPIDAIGKAVANTADFTVLTLESIGKMIAGLLSLQNLSGPITIAKVAGEAARSGLESYLSLLAYLSISLGVLNLLPIPILDGGHLLYYSIEWLRGRPLSMNLQMFGMRIGMAILGCIMVLAFYNDIMRIM